jgi:membrane protein
MRIAAVQRFAVQVYQTWNETKPTRLAAALAYYGMFSLAPVIFVAYTVADIFAGELATTEEFFLRLERTLGTEGAQFLYDQVIDFSERASTGATLTSLIGFVALAYSASGLFTSLQYALNVIWDATPATGGGVLGSVRNRLVAFALVIGVGIVLIVASVINLAISLLTSFLDLGSQTPVLNFAYVLVLSTLCFAVLYKTLPSSRVAWVAVWPGAFVAALMFGIGGWLLGFYFSHSSLASGFAAAGAMAVVLVAMYYFAQMFLFGAVFTRAFALTFGAESALPAGKSNQLQDDQGDDL